MTWLAWAPYRVTGLVRNSLQGEPAVPESDARGVGMSVWGGTMGEVSFASSVAGNRPEAVFVVG